MIPHCPDPACPSLHFRKFGTFYRASDAKRVQRWMCNRCKLHFSSATFQKPYRQHKRRVNPHISRLLSSGVSLRRIALILNLSRTTVARKLAFLASLAQDRQRKWLRAQPKVAHVQFDDLLTFEHSKCKPLAISLAVEAGRRRLLGFQVSSIPASGRLAERARRKYGPRPNERPKALFRLFTQVKELVAEQAAFASDEDPLYPAVLRKVFPKAVHERYPGGRGCVTGQGELKKLCFDPLFSLNHTCAMLRANLNRLFRRTWCTTKKKERLAQHLAIYMDFHNRVLVEGERGPGRPGRCRKEEAKPPQQASRPV